MKKNKHILMMVFAVFAIQSAIAATRTWTGGTSTNWTTSSNWQGGVPGSNDDVIINSGSSFYPVLTSTSRSIKSLTMNGGTFTMSSGDLNIGVTISILGGTFNGASGDINISNNFVVDGGTFNAGSGDISVNNAFTLASGTYIASSGDLSATDIEVDGGTFTGGAGRLDANDFIITGGTMSIRGNTLNVGNDFIIDGGSVSVNTADLTIQDDLFLTSGSLDMNNFDLISEDELHFEGATMTDFATVTVRDLHLDFTGSYTLYFPIRVTGTTTLTSGIFVSSSSNLVTYSASASGANGSASSHINGPVRKEITASGSMNTFVFPIGNGSVNAPLTISSYNNRNSQDFFTATYFNSRNSNAGASKASGIDHVSQAEYWDLTRGSSGTASTQVIVSLSYDETTRSGQVDNASQLLIAHWTGSQWENLGRNGGNSSGNATAGVTAANSRSTTYSPFTLGSSSTLNPLPIELLSFAAKANNSNVTLNWSTASELNNAYFTVEKSLDGSNWNVIGKVNSVGNTEKITDYTLTDINPVIGVQYYRLKQTDINGQFTYSQVVPVNFSGKVVNSVVIYPSPASNVLNIEVSASESGQTNISIYNAMGIKVMELNGDEKFYSVDITSFAAGVYYIEVNQDGNTSKSKVLKY